MGRILKPFTATTPGHRVAGVARIDTGADRTVLQPALARQLGFDPDSAPEGAVWGVGRTRVPGHYFRARISVGGAETELEVFVPAGPLGKAGTIKHQEQGRNLIGADFLQKTGRRLDFSRRHSEVLQDGGEVGEVEETTITPEESAALRAWAKVYYAKPRRRRRAGVKVSPRDVLRLHRPRRGRAASP